MARMPLSPPLLSYDSPAREALTEGLPLGNGRLGALVCGDPRHDRWVINEATLFSGGPYDPTNPEALSALPKVRQAIFAGEYRRAAELAEPTLMGQPKYQAVYQPLGELLIECEEHLGYTEYRRELDLDRAVLTVEYALGGIEYVREVFVSAVDQVLVARFSASHDHKLSLAFLAHSDQRPGHAWMRNIETWHSTRGFGFAGRNHPHDQRDGALQLAFSAELRTATGRVLPGERRTTVRDASEVVLVAAAATSYLRFDNTSGDPEAQVAERLAQARAFCFEELLERHLADFQPRFRRFSLDLGPSANGPTDRRIAAFSSDTDPGLAALYVQYARYLLLACSRPGGQPMNLQGLFNDKLSPPWGCKCTININTEMNYWPALPAALGECVEPLFTLVEDLAHTGARTAQRHYGARGWVAHHNVDLWRATAPTDGVEWGLWPMGGAWLALTLWDSYEYSLSRELLTRCYPLLRGACLFFVDTLVEDPRSGAYVTCPSLSPENQHPHGTALCAGPTMDTAILRDLFAATQKAASLLTVDEELVEQLNHITKRLPPYRIGKAGQLTEWQEDWDIEAPEPHHRHVSHLFGLYPSQQISVRHTPHLARAARTSLELRGDEATGWSLAWKVNLWARLGDAERSYRLLRMLLHPDRSYPNLFDAHPPFQIDGNFGGAAGILEMLVQSAQGELHLLPAVPSAFRTGTVTGLRARGGITVDMTWRDLRLLEAQLVSVVAQRLDLYVADQTPRRLELQPGVPMVVH